MEHFAFKNQKTLKTVKNIEKTLYKYFHEITEQQTFTPSKDFDEQVFYIIENQLVKYVDSL